MLFRADGGVFEKIDDAVDADTAIIWWKRPGYELCCRTLPRVGYNLLLVV